MTKEKAVSLLSQMFLIQFSKEEHEALAMAIDAFNADRKTESQTCETCKHKGKWENEFEYGYPSPCTGCVHRALSRYEPKDESQTKRSK